MRYEKRIEAPPPNPVKPDLRHRATVWAEWLLLFALAAAFLWRGFIPAWKTLNSDFPDYYLAARLYHQGYSLNHIYDWTWFERQKDHAGIERSVVTFTLLTPLSLLPVLPFSSLPPLPAKHCWLLVNLMLLGLTGYFLRQMTQLNTRRVALLIFLCMIPLRTNFHNGQEYVLLLFLLTLAAWCYLRRRPVAAGAVLAVAAVLKIYPAVFIFFFARKKQWGGAISLLVGTIALWMLSAGLFGFETIRVYFTQVLPWPLRAEGQDPYSLTWNSFSALFHRLFVTEPDLNPHPMVHLPAAYAFLQPICQALIFVPCLWLLHSSRSDPEREKLDWGVYVAMLLILSTNPVSYDFNLLIITAVFAFDFLVRAGRRREARAVVVLYSLVCFPVYRWAQVSTAGFHLLLAFPRLWAMTALWICLLAVLWRSRPQQTISWRESRETASFAVIGLVLVALGVTFNLRSQRGEFDNYATRLVAAPEFFLSTDPTVEGGRVIFTAMTLRGYYTEVLNKGSLARLDFESDSFHPVTVAGYSTGWAELAATRSRIVSFALRSRMPVPGDGVVVAENAEKPAVSWDHEWLAFIRETKGRGTLWVKPIQSNVSDMKSVLSERRLSTADLDVLDITFGPRDQIIFSARQGGGQPALFTTNVDLGGQHREYASKPRRFPAVSPDGRWLAFSQLDHGYWQLWVQDPVSHAERSLTHSECNSVAPAWYPDSKHLVYATDCGRGFGLTALCGLQAVP